MASELRDSSVVLSKGNVAQFEFLLSLYPQALQLKSESKKKKPEELKKFDNWYHNELPKRIQQRSKKEGTGYLTHEELIQTIKWKLARGKWRPRLKELITMNTPRVVQLETKKAIRQLMKKDDLTSAIQAMSNLKGVGPAMASAVLSATLPDSVPYMSDECMLAMPGMSERTIEYTVAEYLKMVDHVRRASQRLCSEEDTRWTPHCIEQVMFAHHVIAHNKPELLQNMPAFNNNNNNSTSAQNGAGDSSHDQQKTDDNCVNGETSSVTPAEPVSACGDVIVEEDADTNDSVGSALQPPAAGPGVTAGINDDAAGTVAAASGDDTTNDSVVSIAGSSSCATLNADDEVDDVEETASVAAAAAADDVGHNDGQAWTTSSLTPTDTDQCHDNASNNNNNGNNNGNNNNEQHTTTTAPLNGDNQSETDTPKQCDVTRVKRVADDDVTPSLATPTKCAKSDSGDAATPITD